MTPQVPRQLAALLGKERGRALAERAQARLRADLEDRLGVPRGVVEEALAAALEALERAGSDYGDPLDEATDAELDDRVRAHAWLAVRDRLRSRREIAYASATERRLFETVFAIFRGLIDDDGPTAFTPYELAATVDALQPPSYRRMLWLDVLAGGRVDAATAARCLDVTEGEVDALRGRARAAFAQSLVESFDELRHAAPPELDERPRDPLAFCVGAALAVTDELPRAVEPDLDDVSWRLKPGEPTGAPVDPSIAAAVENARRALEEVRLVDEEVRTELDRSHAETLVRTESLEQAAESIERETGRSRRAVASAGAPESGRVRQASAPAASSDFSSLRLAGPGEDASATSVASPPASTTTSTGANDSQPVARDEGEWPPFRLPAAMRSVADEEWKRSLEAAAEADDDETDTEEGFRLPWHLQGVRALGFDDDDDPDAVFDWPAFALPSRRGIHDYEGLRVGALDLDEIEGGDSDDASAESKTERPPLEGPDADRFRRYLAETGAPPLLESRFDAPARSRSKRDAQEKRRSSKHESKRESSKRSATSSRQRKDRARVPAPESAEHIETKTEELAREIEARAERAVSFDEPKRDESPKSRPAVFDDPTHFEERTAIPSSSDSDGLRLPSTAIDDDLKCELKPERKSFRERLRGKKTTPRGEAPPISSRPAPPPVRPAPPAPWMPPEVEREVAASPRPAPMPWSPPPVEREESTHRPTVARTSAPWTPPPLPPEELRVAAPAPARAPAPAPMPTTAPAAPSAAPSLPASTEPVSPTPVPPTPASPTPASPTIPAPTGGSRELASPAPAARESTPDAADASVSSAPPLAPTSVGPPPADAGRAIEWTARAPATGFPDGIPAVVRGAEIPITKPVDEPRAPEPKAAVGSVEVSAGAGSAGAESRPASSLGGTPVVADVEATADAEPAPPAASPQAPPTVFRAVFKTSGPGVSGPAVPQRLHPKGSPSDSASDLPPNVVDIPVVSGAYAANDPASTRDDDSENAPLTLPAHMAYPDSYDPYAPRPVSRVSLPDDDESTSSEKADGTRDDSNATETSTTEADATSARTSSGDAADVDDRQRPDGAKRRPSTDPTSQRDVDDPKRASGDADVDTTEPKSDPLRSRDRKTISSAGASTERRLDSSPTPRDSDEPFWLTAKRDRGASQRERGTSDGSSDEASSKVAFEMPRPTPNRMLPRRGPLHEPRRERAGILRLLKAKVTELMHPGQKAQRERAEVQQRLDAYLGPRAKPRPTVDKNRKSNKGKK